MKTGFLGAAIGVLAAASAGAAMAQSASPASATTPPQASAPQPEEPTGLAEVIVTAQRREQSAQNVGIALSVLSGEDLKTQGVTTVNQLQYSVPSLEAVPAFGGGQPQFRLRGVGFDDYASNNSSPVQIYVDEVAYPLPIQTQGLLFDVDRVEVLRGPQGTLYGENTTGGAVNFITKRPTDRPSAGISAEYGSYGLLDVEGFVSGPITSTLTGRLAAATVQGGGFQSNRTTGEDFGDADRLGVRGQLDWKPSANVDFLLEGTYGRDKSDGGGLYLFQPLNPFGTATPLLPADNDQNNTGWGASPAYASLLGISTDTKPFRDNQSEGVNLNGRIGLGDVTLSTITAYNHFERREYNDWDASQYALAGTYFDSDGDTFSEEVRLSSNTGERLHWLVGAYYSHQSLDENFDSDFVQSLGFIALTSYGQTENAISAFGQVEYQITPKLNVVLGLREEHESKKLENFLTSTNIPGVAFASADEITTSYTKPSGKLALEYHPEDNTLLYASVSRGVKSGGFTAYNSLSVDELQPFKPETLWAYEVGFKSDFLDNTLRLNGAAFYYDYSDQQVQSAIYSSVYGAIGKIVNADKSKVYGAELEALWRPVAGLQISQALGYKRGEFREFEDLDITASSAAGHAVYVSRAGEDEGFPKLSYNGSVAYTWNISDFAVQAEADYAFHDTLSPVLLGPAFTVDKYWLANASLTLTPAHGPWSVAVFGRNIFNEKYDLTRNFFLGGIDIAAPGRPATWGVRVSLGF